MQQRIYVGNLPFKTTDNELEELFRPFGEVISAQVIRFQKTQRSKGYGFVEMNDEEAKDAIEKLEETDFNGRNLRVKLANPRENFPQAEQISSMKSIRIAIE